MNVNTRSHSLLHRKTHAHTPSRTNALWGQEIEDECCNFSIQPRYASSAWSCNGRASANRAWQTCDTTARLCSTRASVTAPRSAVFPRFSLKARGRTSMNQCFRSTRPDSRRWSRYAWDYNHNYYGAIQVLRNAILLEIWHPTTPS